MPGQIRKWYAAPVRVLPLALLLVFSPASVRGVASDGERPVPASPIGKGCRQLFLVRAASWAASTGAMQRYERRDDSTWGVVGPPIPVDLGRNGLAWGRGLQAGAEPGPLKREGDGKSPAGVYRLGTAFGVADSLPASSRSFPYLQTLPTTYCVEETRSTYYNQIVDSTRVTPPSWEQWSEMLRADGLFNWGVVVQQNAPDIKKGAGSCVFLHIWRGPNRPTAGCTAMPEESLEEALRWLDADLEPTLVQLPEPVFQRVRDSWGLP